MFKKVIKYVGGALLGVAMMAGAAFAGHSSTIANSDYRYKLEKGQFLGHASAAISAQFNEPISYQQLGDANEVKNYNVVREGDSFKLPQWYINKIESKKVKSDQVVESNEVQSSENLITPIITPIISSVESQSSGTQSLEEKIQSSDSMNSTSNIQTSSINSGLEKELLKIGQEDEQTEDVLLKKKIKYVVLPGEGYSHIAKKYGIYDWKEIAEQNGNISLHPGTILNFDVSSKNMVLLNKNDYIENRRKTLEKKGSEIREERFGFSSLNVYAKYLNIVPGEVPEHKVRMKNLMDSIPKTVEVGKKYGISPYVLLAKRYIEGAEQFMASKTGCLGPDGLVADIFDPKPDKKWSDGKTRTSINPFVLELSNDRSADFLQNLFSVYGNLDIALTAYNQGEPEVNKVMRALARKHNITTQNVRKRNRLVLKHYKVSDIVNIKVNGEYYFSREGRSYASNIRRVTKKLEDSASFSSLVKKEKSILKSLTAN